MNIFPQIIVNSLIAGAIYTLISLGFNLIYGSTKFFNISHGAMAAVGGYAVFYIIKKSGLPVIPCVIAGIVIAGIAGYLLDKLIYEPLREKKASNLVLLVASLGAFTAIQAIIAILFSSQFQSLSRTSQKTFNIAGGIITRTQVILLFFSIIITLAIALLLKFTLFGKEVKAVSDDEEVSKIVGINTNKIISYVFFIGSSIMGFAGILIGFDIGLEPTIGMRLLLKGVIAAIIGGVGNIYGGIMGAFLLGFVENFGIWKISGEWKDAISFVLLIVFLLFRPNGIMNRE